MTFYPSLQSIASEEGQGKQDRNIGYFCGRNIHQDSLCSTEDREQNPLDLTPLCLVQADKLLLAPGILPSSLLEIIF
jgi:hypothetical protein